MRTRSSAVISSEEMVIPAVLRLLNCNMGILYSWSLLCQGIVVFQGMVFDCSSCIIVYVSIIWHGNRLYSVLLHLEECLFWSVPYNEIKHKILSTLFIIPLLLHHQNFPSSSWRRLTGKTFAILDLLFINIQGVFMQYLYSYHIDKKMNYMWIRGEGDVDSHR